MKSCIQNPWWSLTYLVSFEEKVTQLIPSSGPAYRTISGKFQGLLNNLRLSCFNLRWTVLKRLLICKQKHTLLRQLPRKLYFSFVFSRFFLLRKPIQDHLGNFSHWLKDCTHFILSEYQRDLKVIGGIPDYIRRSGIILTSICNSCLVKQHLSQLFFLRREKGHYMGSVFVVGSFTERNSRNDSITIEAIAILNFILHSKKENFFQCFI